MGARVNTATIFSSGFVSALAFVTIACGGGGDAPECHPVTVQVFGDSIGVRYAAALQIEADAARGRGAVLVEDRAVSGTNSNKLIQGTDGKNAPWPAGVGADLVLVNHGTNDRTLQNPNYLSNLQQFAAVGAVVIVPLPRPSIGAGADPFRDAALSIPGAIDANAYTQAISGWQALFPDDIHPVPALSRAIARDLLLPRVPKCGGAS